MKFLWGILIVFIFCLNFVSSAHYVVGYVNNALDGEDANGKTVLLWNPTVGPNENIIGIVGPMGDAMQSNLYMFDCEELTNGCSIEDQLAVKVVDNGDGYVSHSVFVNVTVAGYDFTNNITLNSLPEVNLFFPENNFYSSLTNVDFNCSFFDLDYSVGNLSLFGNFSGSWQEEGRYEVGSLNHIFNEIISEGVYFWNCISEDNLRAKALGENRTLTVDLTLPQIDFFELNTSTSCGNTSLIATCGVSDNYEVEEVLLEVNKPRGIVNLSMDFLLNNYTKEIFINEVGTWSFRCIAKDYASNYNFSDFLNVLSYSGLPELSVNFSRITIDKEEYMEGETVKVGVYIENKGCVDSTNFDVSLFRDSILFQNQLGLNQSISLESFSEDFVNFSYAGFIGKNNLFVFADSGEEINESDELDNFINNSFSITLWQKFYGNVSAVKILQIQDDFNSWINDENVIGNIFVTDSEAIINWLSLKALGRTIFDLKSLDDFAELDSLFGTSNFEDSISNTYLSEGDVLEETDFFIHKNNILNVPVVNTTDNGNFITGILWDSSDDSGDNEFSEGDREDLIFVTKLNNGAIGEYGTYDYEIEIPVELRSYDSSNSEEVYLYYDLV